jgi:hypothetical protein
MKVITYLMKVITYLMKVITYLMEVITYLMEVTIYNTRRNAKCPYYYFEPSMKPRIKEPTKKGIFIKPRKLPSTNESTIAVFFISIPYYPYCGSHMSPVVSFFLFSFIVFFFNLIFF